MKKLLPVMLSIPFYLFATEENAKTNTTIVVSATELPRYTIDSTSSASFTETNPETLPVTIDTLTEDFIRDRNPTDLDQLISYMPGIFQGGKTMMSRNAGSYSIRGFGGSEVLFNGVPLAAGVGTFLDPVALERIDIVKGPIGTVVGGQGSSLGNYGAGGSINIVSKQPIIGENFTSLEIRGSSGHGSGKRGKFSIDSNYTLDENAGIYARVPFAVDLRSPDWAPKGSRIGRNYTIAPTVLWQLEDRLSITLNLFSQYSNQPAYQGIPTKYGRPISGMNWDGNVTRPGDRMKFFTNSASVTLDGKLGEVWRSQTKFSFMRTDFNYDYRGPSSNVAAWTDASNPVYEFGAGKGYSQAAFASQFFVADFDTADVTHEFVVGLDYRWKYRNSKSSFGTEEAVNKVMAGKSSKEITNRTGLFLQDTMTWNDLTLLVGGRTDLHTNPEGIHRWGYAPRIGISYLTTDWLTLFANISMTSAPNFTQKDENGKYFDKPWESRQYEAGFRLHPVESLTISTSVFEIEQKNTPSLVSGNVQAGTAVYALIGERKNRGFECSIKGEITDNWSIFGAYTFIHQDTTFDSTPPHSFSLWTNYKAPWFFDSIFGMGYRWRDAWEMTMRGTQIDQKGTYAVKALGTFDASIEIPLTAKDSRYPASLSLAIRNIFDERGIESARNGQAFANEGRTAELCFRIRF